jgi:hypothetical protein
MFEICRLDLNQGNGNIQVGGIMCISAAAAHTCEQVKREHVIGNKFIESAQRTVLVRIFWRHKNTDKIVSYT